jgi:hypothetical protein
MCECADSLDRYNLHCQSSPYFRSFIIHTFAPYFWVDIQLIKE